MTLRLRTSLAFLLLLALVVSACTPLRGGRGRGGNGGGGDGDFSEANDDDAGDDDDATDDTVNGTVYYGEASGFLKSSDGGGECSGPAEVVIDEAGYVVDGRIDCGSDCVITFEGPYAFSEESFTPEFDCSFQGTNPSFYEIDAWIWGTENDYTGGSISGYGEVDYFWLDFDAYVGGAE